MAHAYRENNEWKGPRDSLYVKQKGLFNVFYKTPAFLAELDTKDFYFRINPVLHFEVLSSLGKEEVYYRNLRGLELRGGLDGKLYFYTNILETQARFPGYVNDWISKFEAVPGAGFYKEHNSRIFNVGGGYDFLRASGYVGFQASKHFSLELGHASHFIGDGMRSMFLSDFAGNHFYLKFNTRVWKLHYQNLFGELSPISSRGDKGDALLPKKVFCCALPELQAGRQPSFWIV